MSHPDSSTGDEEEQSGGVTLPVLHQDNAHTATGETNSNPTLRHFPDTSTLSFSTQLLAYESRYLDSNDSELSLTSEHAVDLHVNEGSSSSLTPPPHTAGGLSAAHSPQTAFRSGSMPGEDAPGRTENVEETMLDNDSVGPDLDPSLERTSPTTVPFTSNGLLRFFDLFNPGHYHYEGRGENLSVVTFLETWKERRSHQDHDHPPDRVDYLPPISHEVDRSTLRRGLKELLITTEVLDLEECNFQGLNWKALGTTYRAVREARRKTYLHHVNVLLTPFAPQYADINGPSRFRRHTTPSGKEWAEDVPDITRQDNHFRFRQMNLKVRPYLTHFQLRHMLSASSKNAVFYAGKDQLFCLNPETHVEECIMKFEGCQHALTLAEISTLTATHDLLIVGDLVGQYAVKSLSTSNDNNFSSGRLTFDSNGCTNHAHTFLSRQSGIPRAVFCSNDGYVRILDCCTNTIVKNQEIGWAINCSSTSPDSRLRLLVGDHTEPWVVEAETGKQLVKLPNHKDYGFACDWAPDSIHVATGNQDGIVQIFDCRNWKQPIQVLPTELGGIRTMKFSPLGSGKRVLAMAEPADFISIVDAETFRSQQRFEFLGEVGGLSFTPDGLKLFVANTDAEFGGVLEFDRAGDGERYGFACPEFYDKDSGWIVDDCVRTDEELLHSSTERKRRCRDLGKVLV